MIFWVVSFLIILIELLLELLITFLITLIEREGMIKLFSEDDYKKYLMSDGWKKTREMRLNYDGNKCKNCGSTENLQVHHKCYDFEGREDVKNDLITLCYDCHYKITLLNRRKRKVICE